MSSAPPAERVPLVVVYMCPHRLGGYLHRADGLPLNTNSISDPSQLQADMAYELADQQFEFHPPPGRHMRRLLGMCGRCRQRRRARIRRLVLWRGPENADRVRTLVRQVRAGYVVRDTQLLERALALHMRATGACPRYAVRHVRLLEWAHARLEPRAIVTAPETDARNANENRNGSDEEPVQRRRFARRMVLRPHQFPRTQRRTSAWRAMLGYFFWST